VGAVPVKTGFESFGGQPVCAVAEAATAVQKPLVDSFSQPDWMVA
jgi:hypothetical protein